MEFRIAKYEELDTIYDICLSIKEIYKDHKVQLWNEYYPLRENFEEDIKHNNIYVYVIDNQIVASISLENSILEDIPQEDNVVILSRIMVRPDFQNRGIGTDLINQIENVLKYKQIHEIKFLVNNNNPRAIKLYERLGYTNFGYYKTPWEEEDSYYLLFRKNIKD